MQLSIIDPDQQFFVDHPDRQAHIRLPIPKRVLDKRSRAMVPEDECAGEFFHIGPHEKKRRRILIWRVPANNPWYDPKKQPLLKIPFLAFADETIEDSDATLLPIIHTIMEEAARG